MRTKMERWGDGLGLRIPRSFAVSNNIEEGTVVHVSVEDGNLSLRPAQTKRYKLSELLKQVRPETLHEEIDFGHPRRGH